MSDTSRKPVGGILEIGITPADNVAGLYFDAAGRCIGVSWRNPLLLAQLPLTDFRSSYAEQTESGGGIPLVRHTLTVVAGFDPGRAAFDTAFLAEASEGVAALVTLLSGARLLVGWSQRFKAEQPLRLRTLTFDSGCNRSDRPAATLVLESADTAPAIEIAAETAGEITGGIIGEITGRTGTETAAEIAAEAAGRTATEIAAETAAGTAAEAAANA